MNVALLAAFFSALTLSGCSPAGSNSDAATGSVDQKQEIIFSYDLSKSPQGISKSFEKLDLTVASTPEDGGVYASISAAIKFPDGKLRMANLGSGPIDGERQIWIGKLSPRDAGMSLVFSNETGGNRCCSELFIVSEAYGKDAALYVQMSFGSDLKSSLGDFNKDGIKDFVTFDTRFLGGFITSGVGTYSVPKVVNVFNGQLVDISRDPGLKDFWTEAQASAEKDCADPQLTDNDGACAAYVAIGARLGRIDESIAFAIRHIRAREEPYYVCSFEASDSESCPQDSLREFDYFGPAIKFALGIYGYV